MKLAFLDTETTGTNSFSDRIIEIGIIFIEDDQIVNTYSSLINPQTTIDPFITQITGIKTSDLTNAPTFEDIALTLKELLSNYTIVAHNARFDYSFIRSEYRRLGIKFESDILCTVRLSRRLYPEHHHHNLDSIIRRFNIDCPNRHRAFDDANVLVNFFNHIKNNFSSDRLTSDIRHLTGHPSQPINIPESEIQKIPHTSGVYIFYDQQHQPLYVGKSKDLKNRVFSHFYESINSSKEMRLATFTYFLETIPTAGELSALILESKLIKQLQPAHNRLLRLHRKLLVLTQSVNIDGYFVPEVQILDHIPTSFLGIFKSRRQLDNHLHALADEYNLCPKLLGLENSKSSCFSYHLGKCKGACTGEEKPLFYNIRFQQAFSKTKLKRWPFPGPILITESDPDSEISHYFIVDQWCILSESDDDIVETLHTTSLQNEKINSLDLDLYKILLRFIFDAKNQNKIKTLR